MARRRKDVLIDAECACCGYQTKTTVRQGVVLAAKTRTRQCAAMPDVWICTVCMTNIENKRNLVDLSTAGETLTQVEIA